MKAHDTCLSRSIARRRAGPARLGGTVPQIISTTPLPISYFLNSQPRVSTTRMTDGRLMSRPMTERRMPRRECFVLDLFFDFDWDDDTFEA